MIAKYAGQCAVSGREIVAGETEIVQFGGNWVLPEYASTEAMLAEARRMIDTAELAGNPEAERKYSSLVGYPTMARFKGLRSMLELLIRRRANIEAEHLEDPEYHQQYPNSLCRHCVAAGWQETAD